MFDDNLAKVSQSHSGCVTNEKTFVWKEKKLKIKKNKYIQNFRDETDKHDFLYLYLNDEFYLDHLVLKEFIDIEDDTKPQKFEQMAKIHTPFEYYSQVVQFSANCRELIHKEIMGFIAQVK